MHPPWRARQHIRRVRRALTTLRKYSSSYRNPLGSAIGITALDILLQEDLANRALKLGEIFRSEITALKHPLVSTVRGRGPLNAVVIDEEKSTRGRTAWQFCLLLKSRGVLAKPTHVNMYVTASPLALQVFTRVPTASASRLPSSFPKKSL